MSFRQLAFLVLIVGIQISGCATDSGQHALLVVEGKVVYQDLEGGFWAIDAENGQHFLPTNLPDSFHQRELKVRLKAIPQHDAMSAHMYGTIIEIQEISVRP